MKIENVFAALEEYFEARKNLSEGSAEGSSEDSLVLIQERAKSSLDLYIKDQFNQLILDDKRDKTPTIEMVAVNPSNVKVAWEDVVNLLDALNSPPLPLEQENLSLRQASRWMEIYKEWYGKKRIDALLSVTPLDFETKKE